MQFQIFFLPLMAHLACALQNYLSILLVHMHMLRRKQKPTRRQEDDFFFLFSYHYGKEVTE